MRHRIFLCILLTILATMCLISTGCEKNGKIRIANRTSYPLYAVVLDTPYTIAPGSDRKINVTTETQYPFTNDVGKYVRVSLQGETYQIWDDYLSRYVDSTYVWVNAGKTTSIYTMPNRASVKVKNQSGLHIKRVIVRRVASQNTITDNYEVDLDNGESWYKAIPFATTGYNFYLTAQVVFDDNSMQSYGNQQTIMHVDEQFLIEVLPLPEGEK